MNANTKRIHELKWIDIITRCNQSGMKKEEWMEQNGINSKSFYRNQKLLREQISQLLLEKVENEAVQLQVPVSSVPHISTAKEVTKESFTADAVITVGNVSISLSNNVSETLLKHLESMVMSYAK